MVKLFLGLCMICMSALSHADQPIFADMQWGVNSKEVTNQLTAKGFSVSPQDKDGDISFKGTLVGEPFSGLAIFAGGKFAKVFVRLATPDNKAISKYQEMKDILSNKYGEPDHVFANFTNPYYAGDGYEEQAISLGKAQLASLWKSGLALEISDKLTVDLSYESSAWGIEADKRKIKAASVF